MDSKNSFSSQIISAISSVVGSGPVTLHEPSFNSNEWLYVKDAIDSSYVSSVGGYVNRFESELAKFTGAKYAVAVVNGTAALHIALKLAGVQAGEEVLVPTLTFIATANAVSYCNAFPHLVDCEQLTLGIDADKLRDYLTCSTEQRSGQCINLSTGRVIRALVPMHTFGHPSKMDHLLSIASDFNIVLVEDAAESLGSYYCGKHTGTLGLIGALSFNGNKIITTGGGGAILTNDRELAVHAKHLTTTAKLPHAWQFCHDEIGYNYRLPNLNAALGCAQLEALSDYLLKKRKLFDLYHSSFSNIQGVNLFSEPPKCKSNYWLQTLILDSSHEQYIDIVLKETNDAGFMTRPAWLPLHRQKMFCKMPQMDLSEAESLSRRLINIPSSPSLIINF